MRSLQRRLKRGHARLVELPFIKNEDGSNKIIVQKKTKRGRWVNN
jgi:hypothetical protein